MAMKIGEINTEIENFFMKDSEELVIRIYDLPSIKIPNFNISFKSEHIKEKSPKAPKVRKDKKIKPHNDR